MSCLVILFKSFAHFLLVFFFFLLLICRSLYNLNRAPLLVVCVVKYLVLTEILSQYIF